MALEDLLGELGISQQQVDEALKADEIKRGKVELAEKTADVLRSFIPEDTGESREAVKVVDEGDDVKVLWDSPIAHILEYGSEDTPEFAPRAKTEAYFRGAQ